MSRNLFAAWLLGLLLAGSPAAVLGAEAAAWVAFVVGEATASLPDQPPRQLVRGSEVGPGDSIRTGPGGRLQLRFSDGSQLSLNPGSLFRIDDYQFATTTPQPARGFFSLLQGGLRTITGLIGKARREDYRMQTTVATIGIRGTDYGLEYATDGGLVATTYSGQIEVCNEGGCLLLDAGESARVNDGHSRPVRNGTPPPLPGSGPAGGSGSGDSGFAASGERRGSGIPGGQQPPVNGGPSTAPTGGRY
ncbi:FecR family protein [Azospira oryzae]|uniref:FecR family protein n=1 Tax=Azospira oryzae TaxID=146939 RepID=UPI0019629D64|nr:FecR family protein [Azospira oryzae]